MQGTQYATKRSILCRGAFCGPTKLSYFIKIYILSIFEWPLKTGFTVFQFSFQAEV